MRCESEERKSLLSIAFILNIKARKNKGSIIWSSYRLIVQDLTVTMLYLNSHTLPYLLWGEFRFYQISSIAIWQMLYIKWHTCRLHRDSMEHMHTTVFRQPHPSTQPFHWLAPRSWTRTYHTWPESSLSLANWVQECSQSVSKISTCTRNL